MRAGERNTPIELLAASVNRDPVYNNEIVTWNPYAVVWAAIGYKQGREFFEDGSFLREQIFNLDLDWMDAQGITTDTRLRIGGSDYNVKSIDPDMDLKRRVVLEVSVGINQTQK